MIDINVDINIERQIRGVDVNTRSNNMQTDYSPWGGGLDHLSIIKFHMQILR